MTHVSIGLRDVGGKGENPDNAGNQGLNNIDLYPI
jgi:hypothetical protein